LAIVIEPYRPEHEPAVAEFNRRLQSGGAEPDLVFYRYAVPHWLPPDGNSIYNQYFVAVEKGEVRGGYALKWQNFWFPGGEIRPVGYYHHPLSEGIVNKAYAIVGTLLLRDAMQRSPLLYCLGMGGYDRPLPRMLVGLGWSHFLVPFYFRVVLPYRFLRQMQALRASWWRSLAADAAAFSGAGWVGAKAYQIATRLKPITPYEVTKEAGFSSWADSLWDEAKSSCAITAVRDNNALQRLYPATDTHFTRLKIRRGGKEVGWAVVSERRKDPKYGSLRVGSIVDCWAAPDDAPTIVHAAVGLLEQLGMDLIVSNQSHQAWCKALEAAGFLKAQSNFILAVSKQLAGLVQPFDQMKPRFHFTRADGDGLPRNF
jgi:hypothetical protein